MTESNIGLMPAQKIREMIAAGQISGIPDFVQPASLDLRLGATAHRVRASFLAARRGDVLRKLDRYTLAMIDIRDGALLEPGCVYVVHLAERLDLPRDVFALTSPKSSAGRLDVFVRVIADSDCGFDTAPHGYLGGLFAEICPQTFPVYVRAGSRLTQMRFYQGGVHPTDTKLLSVALPPMETIGWRARRYTGSIDVDAKPQTYLASDFWEPLVAPEGRLILDPGEFYILRSDERISVPLDMAATLEPIDTSLGEFRVHYAGFFDPGFGFGAPSHAVLEVRSHGIPFVLEHGQPIGNLQFERLTEKPDIGYGPSIGSHYQGQSLRLSKLFKHVEGA